MFAFLVMRTGDLVPEPLSCTRYSRADRSHRPCVTPPGLTSSLTSVPLERLHAISLSLILKSIVIVKAVGMITPGMTRFCEKWTLESSLLSALSPALVSPSWTSRLQAGAGSRCPCPVRAPSVLCLVDRDRPADGTEDPDRHRGGRLRIPQAAVHPDQPRWSWNWEGDPGFPGDLQCQAAHIHYLGQPRPRQDPSKTR